MARLHRDRALRQLDKAEGYLMLDLPERALSILESQAEWPDHRFEACLLRGEALRALGRYRDALTPLEIAASLRPDELSVAICLGWCYKRTFRLAQAIETLERASQKNPDEALLHYNLACYWSLAGNVSRAIDRLVIALRLEPSFRYRIGEESDFDFIRTDPRFEALVVGEGRPA